MVRPWIRGTPLVLRVVFHNGGRFVKATGKRREVNLEPEWCLKRCHLRVSKLREEDVKTHGESTELSRHSSFAIHLLSTREVWYGQRGLPRDYVMRMLKNFKNNSLQSERSPIKVKVTVDPVHRAYLRKSYMFGTLLKNCYLS